MATRSVITVTTGEAGSGKSYARCARFIVDRFLKDHDGPHISNFPLGDVPDDHSEPPKFEGETFADRIAESASKLHKLDFAETRERIQTIPPEVLESWERGESGPWEFFEGRSLQDAHIAIDEIHNYCDAQGDAKLRKRWKQWIGEIRHQGATVEFLSQALAKVPIELRREAGCHIVVKNTETERDPVFRIELGDWYELRAGFITRRYSSNVMEQERRTAMGDARGGWTARRIFPLDPWYFRFYDSFSAPQKGGNKGKAQRRQFERRSRLGLLGWFIASNAGRLVPRVAFLLAIAWVFFGGYVGLGGGPWVVEKAMERMQSYGGQFADGAAAGLTGGRGDGGMAEGNRRGSGQSHTGDVKTLPADVHGVVRVGGETDPGGGEGSTAGVRDRGTAVGTTPAEVAAAIVELRDRIEELETENQALRGVIERTAELVAITEDAVTFRNGFTYRVGEVIDYGPFQGRTLGAINWRRRAATLDDGTSLRMGGARVDSVTDRVLDAIPGTDARGGS